jgi:hypothetical protein
VDALGNPTAFFLTVRMAGRQEKRERATESNSSR